MNIPFKPVIFTGILLAATYLIVNACSKDKNSCMHTTLGRTKCFCEKLNPNSSSFLPHQNIINSYASKDINHSIANLGITNNSETESNNNAILKNDLYNCVHPEDTLSKEEKTTKIPHNNKTIISLNSSKQDIQEKVNYETLINYDLRTSNFDASKQKNDSSVINQKTTNVDLCHKIDYTFGLLIAEENNIADPNDKLPKSNQNSINNTDQKTDHIDKSLEISDNVMDDGIDNTISSKLMDDIVGERILVSEDDMFKKKAENNDANNNLSNIFIITALCDGQKEEIVLSDNEKWHDASDNFSPDTLSNE